MKLADAQHIYMIGIKGVGMTALAEVFVAQGKTVSGSDTDEIFQTDGILREKGIAVHEHFAAVHIPDNTNLVITSTAYDARHVERQEAVRRGIAVLTYPEALAALMRGKYGIAVAGSHGKTTTTALLGHVMVEAGLDPTVIVGSEVKNWHANARVGGSDYVVIEADEYQNKLALYKPKGAIITNIEWDHPDFFKTEAQYNKAFSDFQYSVRERGGWVVEMTNTKIQMPKAHIVPAVLSGKHNTENALLVYDATTTHLGISDETFWKAVASFQGTARRMDYVGVTTTGATVLDDYAHHPTEVRVTLAALRQRFPDKKITIVFHPHTYTRTKQFLKAFAQELSLADHVLVLDIYGSAREEQGGVHARDLVDAINAMRPGSSTHTPAISEVIQRLQSTTGEDDVIITMGAGDVWKIAGRLAR
jgi:UDP-N-acetylmuramate--alanine ligase